MQKSGKPRVKALHPRNLHKHGYDFAALAEAHTPLQRYVKIRMQGNGSSQTIDFADPAAVKALNTALLSYHYGIAEWDIPEGFLCPPIPGRIDYIHYVADLLGVAPPAHAESPKSPTIKMLDVGTGANGIYSLLAIKAYGWDCVACDIDTFSLENVAEIARHNPRIEQSLQLRLQSDNAHIFHGIIQAGEHYDVCVCNPPFHSSLEEALKGSQKKIDKLTINRNKKSSEQSQTNPQTRQASPKLNFGGQKAELWCKGGEIRFLRKMLKQSKDFGTQCRWFTTLISKNENLKPCHKILHKLVATKVKEIEMKQGNKITRILAWTFN